MGLLLLLSLRNGPSKLESSTVTLLVGHWLPEFILWDVSGLLDLLVNVLMSVVFEEIEAQAGPLNSWLLVQLALSLS